MSIGDGRATDTSHVPRIGTQEIGAKLLIVAARVTRLQHETLESLAEPLTFRQYRILARIAEGHTTLTELAKLARRTLPTMSKSVDGLVKRGLIRRVPGETDRRSTILELTDSGDVLRQEAEDVMQELRELLCGPIEANPRAVLHDVLDGIHQRAEDELRW